MNATHCLAVLLLAASLPVRAEGPWPVNFCELMSDPVRWHGRMIEVRAAVVVGGDWWLSDTQCKTQILVRGVRFPNAIALTDPKDKRFTSHEVDFEWDETARAELAALLQHINRAEERVRVTVIGLFETRIPLDDLVQSYFPFGRFGFGDQGAAPGQILVRTIKEVAVEKVTRPVEKVKRKGDKPVRN